ncbi:hypothetical protein FALBO_2295 [Fusarium albosuccineum]|uniref:G domain-containing protein n=1 Tax=Fusarium albosuccineum TaxID=1237068 RepID=A0A8H4LNS6_9HYPO|nr:hypothetical protein FALBO_2295 [Fusarium albosuccineum]
MDQIQRMSTPRPPSAGDVVILVMGVTGVGKSSFISRLTGEDAGIGHDLTSYTKGVGIYSMSVGDRLVYLVDTPGFNDTWRSDLDILKEVAFITSQIYRQGMKLAGILYLHRISDNRVSGSAMKNFTLLEKMCGPTAASRVFLIMTMWDLTETGKLSSREAEMREMRLASTMEFWGTLCQQGSQTRRWRGDDETAISIIGELISLNERDGYLVQQIQRELIDEGKNLTETMAGRELLTTYESTEKKCIEGLRSIESGQHTDSGLDTSITELRSELESMRCAQREFRVSIRSVFAEREKAYGQVLSKVRAEQQQLSVELEQGRRNYQRLEADMVGNDALLEEERQEWQRRRQELSREERTGRRSRESLEAERQRIEEEESEFNEQFNELHMDNEEERLDVGQTVERLRKRDVMKRNLLPFLGILGGTGLAIAGTVTGLAPLAGAGIGVGFAYASKLEFSRRAEDHTGKFPIWEPLLGGGQGASSASLN